MHLSFRAVVASIALCFPVILYAAAPAGVTGLGAEVKDGEILVSWDAVPDKNIDHYRIYYRSGESIIERGGEFDDYEMTPGPENVFVLRDMPEDRPLFITVVAVNGEGEESATFLEEVRVDFAASQMSAQAVSSVPKEKQESTSSSAMSAPVEEVMEEVPVRLAFAGAASPTEVILTFTDAVTVDTSIPDAIRIASEDGTALPITKIMTEAKIVMVETQTQEQGKNYVVTVGNGVQGQDGAALDPAKRSTVFQGHRDGIAPRQGQVLLPVSDGTSADPSKVQWDVMKLMLRAERQPNGLYRVVATWEYGGSDIAGYVVAQTRDPSLPFGFPQQVQAAISGIEFKDTTPGYFGIILHVMNKAGTLSRGVPAAINLAGDPSQVVQVIPSQPVQMLPALTGGVSAQTPTTQATQGRTPQGPLSQSGVGFIAVVALAGGAAGLAILRRKKVSVV